MATEVKVPTLGESVTEASIGELLKNVGDRVAVDEPIVSLETDKVAVEAPSPIAGVIKEFKVAVGDTVEVGAVLAVIEEGGASAAPSSEPKAEAPDAGVEKAAPAQAKEATGSDALRSGYTVSLCERRQCRYRLG